MARKKQEVALQKELNSQEEWDDMISKEGNLVIVDVYQEWCGPCKSILSHFRRIKNESGEDLLQFAVAKADTIDCLDRYRGSCKPCFLFYGSGTLVEALRGVNPPELEKKIKYHLENELKIVKGEPGAERVEIRDPAFKHLDEADRLAKQRAEEEDDDEEIEREVTVVLIKPDAVQKVEEIKQKLEERGIEILEQQERKLTPEEARDFYRHLEGQDWFEQMITYMTTGESIVLVISHGNSGIISEFRELLGPANVEDAKENQPDSLRAIFGSESFMNAIHAADSGEKATKELEFFFPEFKIPTYKVQKTKKEKRREIEKTVAIIRPDAFLEFKDEILAKIKEAGFAIALKKEVQLTKEQAEEFYSNKKDSPFFPELITRMTNGPVLALALAKEDAITEWRKALGEKDPKEAKASNPQSFRAVYSKEDIQINLLHGSDSPDTAMHELEFFFPIEQTLVVIKPDAYENRGEIIQKAKEAEFRVAARKEITLSDEMAREFYKNHAEKEYFEELVAHMTSGNSIFLALSRHDAVAGWRELMGDPDPTKAPENYHSIRSIYGKDIKCNAVHGSSSKEQAAECIRLIFGDIEFDQDGKRVPGTGDVTEEEEQETTEDEDGEMRGPHGEIVRNDAQEAETTGEQQGEDSEEREQQPDGEHKEGEHEGEEKNGKDDDEKHEEGENAGDEKHEDGEKAGDDKQEDGEDKGDDKHDEGKHKGEEKHEDGEDKGDDKHDEGKHKGEEKHEDGEDKGDDKQVGKEEAEQSKEGVSQEDPKNEGEISEDKKDDAKSEDKKDDEKAEDKKDDDKSEDKKDDEKAEDKKDDEKAEDKKDDEKAEDKDDEKAEDKKDDEKAEDKKDDEKAEDKKDDEKAEDKKDDEKAEDKKDDEKAEDKKDGDDKDGEKTEDKKDDA